MVFDSDFEQAQIHGRVAVVDAYAKIQRELQRQITIFPCPAGKQCRRWFF